MAKQEIDKSTQILQSIVEVAALSGLSPDYLSKIVGGSDKKHAEEFGRGLDHTQGEPDEDLAALVKAVGNHFNIP